MVFLLEPDAAEVGAGVALRNRENIVTKDSQKKREGRSRSESNGLCPLSTAPQT